MRQFVTIMIGLAVIGCSTEKGDDPAGEAGHEHSRAQWITGSPEQDTIYDAITCTGMIDVPPESRATISAPLGGYLREVKYYPGQKVSKGEILARVAHPNYIELQRTFLDAKSQVRFLEMDFQRKTELFEQEAINSRVLEEVRSKLESEKARMMAAAASLRQMDIDPSSLSADNIQESLTLRSPLNGYITKINVNLGQHVTPEEALYEIVDDSHMHIELSIFPRDISKVKLGQKIEYMIPGDQNVYEGDIQQIGRQVDDESGAFTIHAHSHSDHTVLRPGQYVEGKILITPREAQLLPMTAVVRDANSNFVFVQMGDHYEKFEVRTGSMYGEQIEILDSIPGPVVMKNAYLLLEAGEAGHSH